MTSIPLMVATSPTTVIVKVSVPGNPRRGNIMVRLSSNPATLLPDSLRPRLHTPRCLTLLLLPLSRCLPKSLSILNIRLLRMAVRHLRPTIPDQGHIQTD